MWLHGSPAGAAALARAVADRLHEAGHRSEILDGEELGRALSGETASAYENWESGIRRIGLLASVLARTGITVLVPADVPDAACRAAVRQRHTAQGSPYLEVHIPHGLPAAPRDLDARPADLRLPTDLRLPVHADGVDACAMRLLHSLRSRGWLRP